MVEEVIQVRGLVKVILTIFRGPTPIDLDTGCSSRLILLTRTRRGSARTAKERETMAKVR